MEECLKRQRLLSIADELAKSPFQSPAVSIDEGSQDGSIYPDWDNVQQAVRALASVLAETDGVPSPWTPHSRARSVNTPGSAKSTANGTANGTAKGIDDPPSGLRRPSSVQPPMSAALGRAIAEVLQRRRTLSPEWRLADSSDHREDVSADILRSLFDAEGLSSHAPNLSQLTTTDTTENVVLTMIPPLLNGPQPTPLREKDPLSRSTPPQPVKGTTKRVRYLQSRPSLDPLARRVAEVPSPESFGPHRRLKVRASEPYGRESSSNRTATFDASSPSSSSRYTSDLAEVEIDSASRPRPKRAAAFHSLAPHLAPPSPSEAEPSKAGSLDPALQAARSRASVPLGRRTVVNPGIRTAQRKASPPQQSLSFFDEDEEGSPQNYDDEDEGSSAEVPSFGRQDEAAFSVRGEPSHANGSHMGDESLQVEVSYRERDTEPDDTQAEQLDQAEQAETRRASLTHKGSVITRRADKKRQTEEQLRRDTQSTSQQAVASMRQSVLFADQVEEVQTYEVETESAGLEAPYVDRDTTEQENFDGENVGGSGARLPSAADAAMDAKASERGGSELLDREDAVDQYDDISESRPTSPDWITPRPAPSKDQPKKNVDTAESEPIPAAEQAAKPLQKTSRESKKDTQVTRRSSSTVAADAGTDCLDLVPVAVEDDLALAPYDGDATARRVSCGIQAELPRRKPRGKADPTTKPNLFGEVKLRRISITELTTESERPKRVRIAPLQWWRNEHIEYEATNALGAMAYRAKAVYKVDDEAPQKKRAPKKAALKIAALEDAPASDVPKGSAASRSSAASGRSRATAKAVAKRKPRGSKVRESVDSTRFSVASSIQSDGGEGSAAAPLALEDGADENRAGSNLPSVQYAVEGVSSSWLRDLREGATTGKKGGAGVVRWKQVEALNVNPSQAGLGYRVKVLLQSAAVNSCVVTLNAGQAKGVDHTGDHLILFHVLAGENRRVKFAVHLQGRSAADTFFLAVGDLLVVPAGSSYDIVNCARARVAHLLLHIS